MPSSPQWSLTAEEAAAQPATVHDDSAPEATADTQAQHGRSEQLEHSQARAQESAGHMSQAPREFSQSREQPEAEQPAGERKGGWWQRRFKA